MNVGILVHKDPADIIQRAQPGNQKGATKDLLFQKSKDEEAKKEYLKELGLLSPTDVSKATGIPRWKISKTICNLIKNEHREPKSNISDIGIHREDIIILTENETTLTTISNSIVVPKYGIKPIAITHIKTKQNYLKSLDLIQIPYFSHYYYDVKNKRILSLNKRTTMKEIRPRRPNSYKLRRSRHAYSVSTKDIDDWLKRPNIQYDDLLSYADLSDILGISRYWWENNGIRQSIMPILHKRYNFKTNKAKIGFDRDELIEALKKSEKTKGFVDKLIKK